MACVYPTLRGEKALKVALNLANWNPIFNDAIPDRNRKERKERITGYKLAKTLTMEQMTKTEKIEYGYCWELFDT